MPRLSLYAAILLAAAFSFHTTGAASTIATCTGLSQTFFDHNIDLCFTNSQRIDCRSYCNHLPSHITENSEGSQGMGEYRPDKHAKWQQCRQDHQLPCQNHREYELNECLLNAQASFRTMWLACPDATTALPPVIPNKLTNN